MDDLMAKLQEILSTDEGQENLKQIAGMLGGQDNQPDLGAIGSLLNQNSGTPSAQNQQNSSGGFDLSALSALLGQAGNPQQGQAPPENAGGGLDLGGLDIGTLMKLQSVMGSMKRDDKNTQLIRALRPHLKEERQHRVDEAIRLMQLISMLPALRESGLLGQLFGGD